MTSILRVVFVLLWALSSRAAARNGCRRCTGFYNFIFDYFVEEAQAKDHLAVRFGNCATGDQYWIKNVVLSDCDETSSFRRCRSWWFDLVVYRYCGNGGSVVRPRKRICDTNGRCMFYDYLELLCDKSVECAGKCDFKECAS